LFEEPTLQNTRAVQLLVPGNSLWDRYRSYVSALISEARSVQLLSDGSLEFRAASPTLLQELEEIVEPNPQAQFEPKAVDQYGTLTEREKQVLALLRFGLSNKEIATRLSAAEGTVSAKTIANYIYNISWKTGIRGRGKLIALARFRSP
jgi:DNA-binding NarL/FixJ family response regulator